MYYGNISNQLNKKRISGLHIDTRNTVEAYQKERKSITRVSIKLNCKIDTIIADIKLHEGWKPEYNEILKTLKTADNKLKKDVIKKMEKKRLDSDYQGVLRVFKKSINDV